MFAELSVPDAWLARLVFQRGLALIYLIAFVSTAHQFRALIGEHGLTPAAKLVTTTPFRRAPSLFHWRCDDRLVAAVAWTGAVLSAVLLAGAFDHVPVAVHMLVWAVPWALYLSIVNVGGSWYAFGWEILLLEAGFLAIFLGPATSAPPVLVLWLLRWLLFRLEFGAGLIKIRGDRCWRDLTCLDYHHQTQPMPGPLSWFFHHLPRSAHRVETAANHLVQLVVVFGLFAPQPVAAIAAALMIVTQLWLMISGNFAWLNALTIVLALPVLGDGVLGHALGAPPEVPPAPHWFIGVTIALTVLIAALSYRPARNLLARRQLMNASFDSLHLVNTYGAFGSVTRVRHEVVIEGTTETDPDDDTVWHAYEFTGKPTEPRRWPRQIAPYHLRLDWAMWFAALSRAYARPWFGTLLRRLLDADPATLRLLHTDPFAGARPAWVRALLYEYRFSTARELRATHACWHRTRLGTYWPPTPAA